MLPKNFVSVQFLRFIAALLVVLSHANFVAGVYWPTTNSKLVTYLFDFGHCGVHIFFVISGFVMVYSTFNTSVPLSAREFLFRRFMRIYPVYWLYAGAYLVWKIGELKFGGDVARSLLLLPGYSSLLIAQGWTLSYEVYFYLCFAGVIALGLNRGLIALAASFMIMISLRRVLPIISPTIDLVSSSLLLEFLAGSAIAAGMLNGVRISRLTSSLLIVAAIGTFLLGVCLGYERIPSALSWGIPSAMLVAGMTFNELNTGLPACIVCRLAFLGNSSYSLYLLHTILLGAMFYAASYVVVGSGLTRFILCLVFSIVCCLISIPCFNLLEKNVARIRVRPHQFDPAEVVD